MCDPILVSLLKMRPHYSQSSRENATPSSGTSPLASHNGVPSPGFAYFPCGIFYSKREWGTCLYTSCLCMYACMIMADDFSLGSVCFKSLQSWDDRLGYVHKSHSQLKLENSQGQPCYDMFSSLRWWCEHSYEALNPILALLMRIQINGY